MGVPFDKPVSRVRDTVAVVRAALTGEKVTHHGRTLAVNGFRLGMEAPVPPTADLPCRSGRPDVPPGG